MSTSFERAEKAIMDYFGDTTNSPEETKEGLMGLRDQIETLLEALEADGV